MNNTLGFDLRKLVLPTGNTIEKQLKAEADRFLKILQEEIDAWYFSYTPTIYNRTYNTVSYTHLTLPTILRV